MRVEVPFAMFTLEALDVFVLRLRVSQCGA